MPQREDHRDRDGKAAVWHHELGWISREQRVWGWSEEAEAQAQLDMDNAEAFL